MSINYLSFITELLYSYYKSLFCFKLLIFSKNGICILEIAKLAKGPGRKLMLPLLFAFFFV